MKRSHVVKKLAAEARREKEREREEREEEEDEEMDRFYAARSALVTVPEYTPSALPRMRNVPEPQTPAPNQTSTSLSANISEEYRAMIDRDILDYQFGSPTSQFLEGMERVNNEPVNSLVCPKNIWIAGSACSVCFEDYENSKVALDCGHVYCNVCAVKIKASNNPKCPQCREKVFRLTRVPKIMVDGVFCEEKITRLEETCMELESFIKKTEKKKLEVEDDLHQILWDAMQIAGFAENWGNEMTILNPLKRKREEAQVKKLLSKVIEKCNKTLNY